MTEANKAFYDRISGVYDSLSDASEHAAREAGEDALDLRAGDRVLEIGFGTGNTLIELAQKVLPGGKIHGLDVSSGMLDVASEKIRKEGLQGAVDLRLGDARNLPYDDASCDAVFLSFTLELFDDDDIPAVLAEAGRVLVDGGKISVVAMTPPGEGEHESMLEKGYVWMHRHFPHIVDCRPIPATTILADNGFEVIHDQRLMMWTMPVAVVVGRRANVA